jgi:hypothetical protein
MNSIYGLMGSFGTAESLVAAVAAGRECGMKDWETFTPYAVPDAAPPEPARRLGSPVAFAMAIAAVVCSSGAFWLQEYAAHDYAVDVGGRPLNSWPAFIPITFELTILGTALTGVITMLLLAGFPRLHHPVFAVPAFRRASQDRFFLLWRTNGSEVEPQRAKDFFARMGALSVDEVHPC